MKCAGLKGRISSEREGKTNRTDEHWWKSIGKE
jgi:hypothetical protein